MIPRLCVAFLLVCLSLSLFAQVPGGRSRGAKIPERSQYDYDRAEPPALQVDPLHALEKELPSLRQDLKLNAEQVPLWVAFAAPVRAAAEGGRSAAKTQLDLQTGSDPKAALNWISRLSAIATQRADALADASKALQALDVSLSAEQGELLDRRMRQAQTEPLGLRGR